MIVEHDRAVPMIEQINQIMNALPDHGLIEGHMIEVIEQTIVEQNSNTL